MSSQNIRFAYCHVVRLLTQLQNQTTFRLRTTTTSWVIVLSIASLSSAHRIQNIEKRIEVKIFQIFLQPSRVHHGFLVIPLFSCLLLTCLALSACWCFAI